MKSRKSFFSLFIITIVTVSVFSFYACQKEQTGAPDLKQESEFFTDGKFKKMLTVSDASGKNSVTFEVSANDEMLLAKFDERAFVALPHTTLPEALDGSRVTDSRFDENAPELTQEADNEPITDQNRYAVKIISRQVEDGVKGIELKFADANASAVGDRACNTFYGYYTNGTSAVGAINNSASCTKQIGFKYYYFNEGIAKPFQSNQPWRFLQSKNTASDSPVPNKIQISGQEQNNRCAA